MSDHKWFQENIECSLAGGLDEAERKRFDAHAADCEDCAAKLEQAKKVNLRLESLFDQARPKAAIEERVFSALSTASRFARLRSSRILRYAAAAAAVLILATVGWTVQEVMLGNGTVLLDRSYFGMLDVSRGASPQSAARLDTLQQPDSGFQVGVDLVGGTLLAYEIPVVPDVDQMAGKFHEIGKAVRRYDQLTHGETYHGMNLPESNDPLLTADIDPAAIVESQDIEYGDKRLEDIGVPGLVDPNKAAGITDAKEPPQFASPKVPSTSTKLPPTSEPQQKVVRGQTDFGKKSDAKEITWFKPGSFHGRSGDKKEKSKKTPEASADQGTAKIRLETSKKQGNAKRTTETVKKQPTRQPEKQKQPKSGRKIIRSGEMEFEVDSFDKGVDVIKNLVKAPGFVGTVNSDRLPNGKVRGSVTVRVPPEHLDDLISNLRKDLGKFGTLTSQRIGSQDITKKYTDMESRLRAARTMEERLLKIIKDGKGEVKDLLLAEKELGVWRTRIEELEGELRYYSNLVALSTLTINLEEKEIQQAAYVSESERVQAGMEVDDVEKTMQNVLAEVKEKKGRVFKSEMKQHGAGQYNAVIHFEVAPEAAGLIRDRLRQLGNLTRLQIDRVQTMTNGDKAPPDAKVKYGDTQFFLSIYNLANVAPRETVTLKYAATDVAKVYHELRDLVTKSKGKVRNAQLNEGDQQKITARLDFDIRRTTESDVQKLLADAGLTLSRQATRVPESENVTDAKVLYKVEMIPVSAIPPRETVTMKYAATDVAKLYQELRDFVAKVAGNVRNAHLNEEDQQKVTARLDFEIPRTAVSDLQKTLTNAGVIMSRKSTRSTETEDVADPKILYQVEFVPISTIPPRETITVGVVVENVKKSVAFVRSQVKDKNGRAGQAVFAQSQDGRVTARIVCEVPMAKVVEFVEEVKTTGKVRIHNVAYHTQAPEGKLAVARVIVTMSNEQQLVPEDEGLWTNVRKGLSVSLRGLSWSVNFLIIGVLFVLPWLVILWIVIFVVRRLWRGSKRAAVGATTTDAAKGDGGKEK